MRRSLWIKVPTVALAAGAFFWLGGVAGAAAAGGIFLAGAAVLFAMAVVPNSSVWVRTLSQASGTADAVALTFDDGPDPSSTLAVADILAAHGVRAAFFMVGERVRRHPEIVARLHEAGHLVCNHTDTHAVQIHFSLWATARRELRACNRAIAEVIGKEPALFRSPQGVKNPALCDVIRELDMTAIGWQVRGLDSMSGDAAAIERRVLGGARPGGVIMLHDGTGLGGRSDRSATIEALPRIIEGLKERGLSFARLDTLLGVEPYRAVAQ
jgi:peptidoglycan/xylan/chitin deacetylase (PgdA/CDA1 family)